MRTTVTLLLLASLAACKPAPERTDDDTAVPTAPPMPEAKADGPAAATMAVSLDGEGLRFVDKAGGKASLLAPVRRPKRRSRALRARPTIAAVMRNAARGRWNSPASTR